MATRNLTRQFRTLRDGFDRQRGTIVVEGAMDENGQPRKAADAPYDPNGPPRSAAAAASATAAAKPFYVDTVKQVESTVSDIESTINKLAEAHKNRLMVRFDDDLDTARDKEIDSLTSQITKRFREAEGLLKVIGSPTGGDAEESADDKAVRLNIQRGLALKLQELSMTFRKSQKAYLTSLQKIKSGRSNIFDDDEEAAPARDARGAVKLSERELLVLEDTQINLKERDREIQKIAKNIEELASIFKELAVLVIDQGTVLDRIDYNMEQVVEKTKSGTEQLKKARQHQKQGASRSRSRGRGRVRSGEISGLTRASPPRSRAGEVHLDPGRHRLHPARHPRLQALVMVVVPLYR